MPLVVDQCARVHRPCHSLRGTVLASTHPLHPPSPPRGRPVVEWPALRLRRAAAMRVELEPRSLIPPRNCRPLPLFLFFSCRLQTAPAIAIGTNSTNCVARVCRSIRADRCHAAPVASSPSRPLGIDAAGPAATAAAAMASKPDVSPANHDRDGNCETHITRAKAVGCGFHRAGRHSAPSLCWLGDGRERRDPIHSSPFCASCNCCVCEQICPQPTAPVAGARHSPARRPRRE